MLETILYPASIITALLVFMSVLGYMTAYLLSMFVVFISGVIITIKDQQGLTFNQIYDSIQNEINIKLAHEKALRASDGGIDIKAYGKVYVYTRKQFNAYVHNTVDISYYESR